jgi:hypothetical protein
MMAISGQPSILAPRNYVARRVSGEAQSRWTPVWLRQLLSVVDTLVCHPRRVRKASCAGVVVHDWLYAAAAAYWRLPVFTLAVCGRFM